MCKINNTQLYSNNYSNNCIIIIIIIVIKKYPEQIKCTICINIYFFAFNPLKIYVDFLKSIKYYREEQLSLCLYVINKINTIKINKYIARFFFALL